LPEILPELDKRVENGARFTLDAFNLEKECLEKND
jgi:hypothetical protein